MKKLINKFLPAGDKIMPEMHLRQLGFKYCACGLFTKTKQKSKKSSKQGTLGISIGIN